MLKNIMTLAKVLQRHAYDILSHKYSVIIIFIAFSTVLISVFQFGEVWMTWSREKYQAVFNSYSDNIVGKSLQNKLCQNVPIDVVYTWVNGSDPLLLQQLQEYQWQLQEETSKKCAHSDCVPSHIITLRHWLSDDKIADILPLIGVKDINIPLVQKVKVANVNRTLIELNSPVEAAEVVKQMLHPNITAYHAHWTSGSTAANILNDTNAIFINGVPDDIMYEVGQIIHAKLTEGLQVEIQNFWIYPEKRLMVVMLDSATTVNKLMQMPNNVTIGGYAVNISKAYLIMELPLLRNSKDFSPSRFEDKEELRYSLRSLEQFAPWVRHVYLVTNGQIPYWLDLENPRLTIITHDMIFPDPTHLPTFSSPAIESHLHRIPGLSRKFLYLNDDVMFGKEVWPDDFITHTNGQKVYLSWPVPDCSESCPWSWIADGSCDVSCNNSECSFDGGDCDLSTEDDFGIYDENRHLINYDDDDIVPIDEGHNQIHESLNDNFFRNMNFGGDIVLENLPDNGRRMNSLLDILIKKNSKNEQSNGNLTFFGELEGLRKMNKSNNLYSNTSHIVTSDVITNNTVIDKRVSNSLFNQTFNRINNIQLRKLAQIQKHTDFSNYITSSPNNFLQDLFENISTINLISRAVNKNTNNNYDAYVNVQKLPDNSSLLAKTWNDSDVYGEYYPKLEKQQEQSITATKNSNKTSSKIFERNRVKYRRKSLRDLQYEGETLEIKHSDSQNPYLITKSNYTDKYTSKQKNVRTNSYNIKFNKLYQKLNGRLDEPEGKHQHSDYYDDWKIEERTSKVGNFATKKQKLLRAFDAQLYSVSTSTGKRPQDTFAASLLYVNRLFNQEFGFEPRKVPAHMPHLIDIDIMECLQARFNNEWQLTSSHKVRSAQDMQFAFSYFYFLMSSKKEIPVSDVFDTFDTDLSGTWSDREIRTLLTRSFELPLNYARVVKFENHITNCSRDLPEELLDINISTPPYERYQDSKLPVVTRKLISNCKPIADMLKRKFGTRKLYQYHIEREKHQEISFKMLNSNISQLISHLDDIRKDPKKFICLNDNLDPERAEDNAIAKAILQDMYESLFPKSSTFELPPEFRNRFLHINELQAWRRSRNTVRTIVYICLAILIAFTLVNFFHIECRWLQRKLFSRVRPQQSSSLVPCV